MAKKRRAPIGNNLHPSLALSADPHAAIAVAVVEQAAHEARRGCCRAQQWLEQVRADILETAPHLAGRLGGAK